MKGETNWSSPFPFFTFFDTSSVASIGGRIEANEDVDQTLEREAMEEVGIVLREQKVPFALWYLERYMEKFIISRLIELKKIAEKDR